jgi:hypothetical protein
MPNHNTKSAPRELIAASWRGAHRPPYLFLSMVIVMKVVGIHKIKLFRNFIFQKSIVIPTGYQHLRRLFSWFWHEQKIRNNKISVMFVTSMGGSCGKLSTASLREVKTKKTKSRGKYGGSNPSPTAVCALSCLWTPCTVTGACKFPGSTSVQL